MAYDPAYADAIASIESGGNYGILGPTTKSGDRAYGKYQIMGSNIGPWSKEILGMSITPQQFIDNPSAQDAIFKGKFGQYVDKYGPEGAAQAWIGGPGAVGKPQLTDQLGTSVGDYGKKFMAALGSQVAPVNGPAPPQQQAGQPLSLAPPPAAPAAGPPQPPPQHNQLGQQQPQQPPPQAPVLNAPQMNPIVQQFNQMRAYQNIPMPTGFQGFRYG